MTEKEITSEYPVLSEKMFRYTLNSILKLDDKDNLTDDRAYMIDLFNTWSDEDDDGFYYDMLCAVKYILENTIAYTTPDKIISLNYPAVTMVPQDKDRWRRWYFIYCHECLHQLWDTFKVGDEIKKELGSYNHTLLNIASDCVINDFLNKINTSHKLRPIGGIFPDVLKKEYDVEYDNAVDTQFTLYMKLYEKLKEDKELMDQLMKQFGDNDMHGDQQEGDNDSQGQGNGQSQNGNGKSGDKNQGGQGDGNSSDKSGDKSDKGDNGDGDKGSDKDSNKGDKGKGDKEGDKGKDGDEGKEGNSGSGKGKGTEGSNLPSDAELIADIERHVTATIRKYSDSISGDIGEFIRKCKSSKKCERPDLAAKSNNGSKGNWKKALISTALSQVKHKLRTRPESRSTYKKWRKGESAYTSSDFENGRPIKKGREKLKKKSAFDLTLFIDISGSMDHCIKNVFKTAYSILDELHDKLGASKLVNKNQIDLKTYVFDTQMTQIKYGSTCGTGGGTYEFDKLISDISKNGADALVNVIITDGEFGSINTTKVAEEMHKLPGQFFLVTNNSEGYFDNVKDAVKSKSGLNKLEVIYTDEEFST